MRADGPVRTADRTPSRNVSDPRSGSAAIARQFELTCCGHPVFQVAVSLTGRAGARWGRESGPHLRASTGLREGPGPSTGGKGHSRKYAANDVLPEAGTRP